MKRIIIFFGLVLSLSLHAQKSPTPLESFTSIDIFGPFEVELIKADKEAMEMDLQDVSSEMIIREVNKGVLRLKLRNKHYMSEWTNERHSSLSYIRVKVYYKDIDELRVQAGAKVFSSETLKSKNLILECSMGAEMDLKITSKRLYTKVSMGAIAELAGQTEEFEAKASMGGELRASRLESKLTYVTANMGADVKVYASDEIEVDAGFGATVRYTGNPGRKHSSRNFGAEINGN